MAKKINLRIANKPDSQEICFIPDDDYGKFIEESSDKTLEDGNFVDTEGNIVGKHKGIIHYTVGQRKGLGLSLGKPMYVTEIRSETNEVVLGSNEETFSKTLIADNLNFMSIEDLEKDMRVVAKVRYSHRGSECLIRRVNDTQVECIFDKPQRAITPGQAVVFYDGDYVLGGGTIVKQR